MVEEKLRHIFDSAIGLFNQFGIRSVTVDDICRELGMSKKTIYQYVESKEDLVRSMLDYRINAVLEIFKKAIDPGHNAIDTLLVFSKMLGDYLKDCKINPALDYDLRKYYPDIYKLHIEQRNKAMHHQVAENIRQGIAQGLYRNELNADLIATLYIQKLEQIAEPDSRIEAVYSFKKIYKVMIESHIRGIANKKGIKYFEKHVLNK